MEHGQQADGESSLFSFNKVQRSFENLMIRYRFLPYDDGTMTTYSSYLRTRYTRRVATTVATCTVARLL